MLLDSSKKKGNDMTKREWVVAMLHLLGPGIVLLIILWLFVEPGGTGLQHEKCFDFNTDPARATWEIVPCNPLQPETRYTINGRRFQPRD